MYEPMNTIDLLGDSAVFESIAYKTIEEFRDDRVTSLLPNAFYGCASLKSISLPALGFKNEAIRGVTPGSNAFNGCTSLVNIDMPKLTVLPERFFNSCNAIETIHMPAVTVLRIYACNLCVNLRMAEFGKLTYVERFAFRDCQKLIAFICRYEPAASFSSEAFSNTPISKGTGYIYVPRRFVESYKSATGWSALGNQIRALEDYTVDGTDTGDLDETKI